MFGSVNDFLFPESVLITLHSFPGLSVKLLLVMCACHMVRLCFVISCCMFLFIECRVFSVVF